MTARHTRQIEDDMTPFHIDMIRTMHEDRRRRLARRTLDTDTRSTRRRRRTSKA